MPRALAAAERRSVQERIARLLRMMDVLDADLPDIRSHEWRQFWEQMRRQYAAALLHFSTALQTRDRRCLDLGLVIWDDMEERLRDAAHRLDVPEH